MPDLSEEEFFTQHAHDYRNPEVVWLERIIGNTGLPMSPNVIAHAIIRAGYVRRASMEQDAVEEWAATDVTAHELGQLPTEAHPTREDAESLFVHDGDDVLLHRRVTAWRRVDTHEGENDE